MDTQEAYRELGLTPGATDAQLKASWRRLVAAWHPDRNASAGAVRRMQQINKAYQHLRQLREGDSRPPADAAAQASATPSPDAEAPETQTHANTHVRKVSLSMEEAILGCTRTLRGHFSHSCGDCVGQGQRVLAQACRHCRGSGAVRKAALFGWLWNQEACADCGGDGRQRAPCEACAGRGQWTVAYRRRVRFPAGVRADHVLSVAAARHGDVVLGLELHVEIEPHPFFTLDGDGLLRCEMPVNGYAWMVGRWVEVPTPDGVQQLRLNRDALVYRLRGQGFPAVPRGPRGDYHVKVVPVFPTKADPAQEALLDRLIARSTRAAEADRSLPLGPWQRQMKRWKASKKEPGREH